MLGFLFDVCGKHANLHELTHSCPTRRSSDLHIENRGSKFAGPIQAVGRLGLNGFTGLGERTQFTAFGTGLDDESRFGEIAVEGRFGGEGLTGTAFVSVAPAEPGSELEDLDVESTATRFGLSAAYPLVRSRRTNLSVRGGFDYARSEEHTSELQSLMRLSYAVFC